MSIEDIARWVAASYDLARPLACELLRSYTNDVYRVQSPDGRFIFKVYGRGWRTAPEVRYEVSLTRHLADRGLAIASPIASTRGEFVQEIGRAEGCRSAVLFEFASGVKPAPPFTPQLYHAFGRAIARMHALSDDFVTHHPRRPLDLRCLIDEPLTLTRPLIERTEDRMLLEDASRRVKERMAELAGESLDWGPIHGDATLDNLHVTADGGIILYDLDSGGPGWRAADLQGWAAGHPEYQERWQAYLDGYASIRPIRPADLRAAPYLTVAWDIWGLKIDLEQRILKQGREQLRTYLREQMARLRERVAVLS
jgi:Ser/Thr protein kinase RdoA (MazF antagonist)